MSHAKRRTPATRKEPLGRSVIEEQERVLARRLRAEIGSALAVRLSVIERLANEFGVARTTIYTLEKHGVATPLVTLLKEGSGRQRLYSLDDAVQLLLGAWLKTNEGVSAELAAGRIIGYQQEKGRIVGRRMSTALLSATLDRTERWVRMRLMAALAYATFGEDDEVPDGTLLVLCRHDGSLPPKSATDGQIRDFLTRVIAKAETRAIMGVMVANKELLSVDSLVQGELDGRTLQYSLLGAAGEAGEFALIAALPPTDRTDDRQRRSRDRWSVDSVTDQEDPPSEHVSDARKPNNAVIAARLAAICIEGLRQLSGELPRAVARAASVERREEPSRIEVNLQLWLLAHVARALVSPRIGDASDGDEREDTPDNTFCEIYTGEVGDEATLRVRASTTRGPWDKPGTERAELPPGTLMVGFVMNSDLTLTASSLNRDARSFINHLEWEKARVGGDIHGIAIRVITSRDSAGAVLYVYRPVLSADEDLGTMVRTLLCLAPIIGEALARERQTEQAVGLISAVLRERPIAEHELREKLAVSIADLDEDLQLLGVVTDAQTGCDKLSQPDRCDARLAAVLVQASGVDGLDRYGAAQWLNGEIEWMVTEVLLRAWRPGSRAEAAKRRAFRGMVGTGTVIIFIPTWLTKRQVDLLRDSTAARLNRCGTARRAGSHAVARLNVWVVDISHGEVRRLWDANRPHSPAGIRHRAATSPVVVAADLLRERVLNAAPVLPELVEAYQGHAAGDWRKSEAACDRGLARQPNNAYLLRMKAFMRAVDADYTEAQRYAQASLAAMSSDIGHVSGWCRYGDALLGQGKLQDAIAAYVAGHELEPNDPLPWAATGHALVGVARIVRSGTWNRLRAAVDDPEKLREIATDLKVVEQLCRRPAELGAVLLRQAVALMANPATKTEGRPTAEPESRLGTYIAALAGEFESGGAALLQWVESAHDLNPRDPFLNCERLIARLQSSAMADTLAAELKKLQPLSTGDAGSLEKILWPMLDTIRHQRWTTRYHLQDSH